MSVLSDTTVESDWRSRELLPLKEACRVVGVSPASFYRAQSAGKIQFRRLAGRTLVTVDSLKLFIDSAEPWSPSQQGSAARAARATRAADAWAQ